MLQKQLFSHQMQKRHVHVMSHNAGGIRIPYINIYMKCVQSIFTTQGQVRGEIFINSPLTGVPGIMIASPILS